MEVKVVLDSRIVRGNRRSKDTMSYYATVSLVDSLITNDETERKAWLEKKVAQFNELNIRNADNVSIADIQISSKWPKNALEAIAIIRGFAVNGKETKAELLEILL